MTGYQPTHRCGVCFQESGAHDEHCYRNPCEVGNHWPPLCCPGCPCASFEDAHGPAPTVHVHQDGRITGIWFDA